VDRQTCMSMHASFNNQFGVANSKLVRWYMTRDPKVRDLIKVLRCWARTNGVVVKGSNVYYSLCIGLLLLQRRRFQHRGAPRGPNEQRCSACAYAFARDKNVGQVLEHA
jgi:hypothetical protein